MATVYINAQSAVLRAPGLARCAKTGDNRSGMRLQVQCCSGRKTDERPVRFQMGDRDYMVEEIVDQWYGPDDQFYKVRADDGNLYILRQNNAAGEWNLESFRKLSTYAAGS